MSLTEVKSTPGQDDYTCGPDKPCSNKACCGEDGWCGYGPKYCGTGCQSHCDAKAECGRYAKDPGQGCPLNSNCETPKPNVAPSNPQKVVIGYWEAWNMDKPCGTMSPGEIPVELLTHLFVSFGYINSAFEVTNMDGIAPHIYKDIGNVKARNPSLKIVIALGGWAFSDPGPWKNIFPQMVSTKDNRAVFIKNLLGFLSQYGYDGVDFDWEYPGAEDRGGGDDDGKNYVSLLKELREAINANGRNYIITFTAPSSYWYLRHFELDNMQTYVDWINLMSYDLHGIWDGDNPIGHQVLSHTNLTESNSALDLVWTIALVWRPVYKADNSSVTSFGELGSNRRRLFLDWASTGDPLSWNPLLVGSLAVGSRDQGHLGAAPRHLESFPMLVREPQRKSSRRPVALTAIESLEIMDILENTGGTPYLDEAAAARYMVYDGHSWISFDDTETFQMKIDYAGRMGLHGLMIWAIDLDTPNLQALRSISNGELIERTQTPFSLVDLERIFPPHMLPPKDAKKDYALINFGSNADGGEIDPNETGFGFILITGDSHVVASLKKREDEPEPFVFLDCPPDVLEAPKNQTQTARVVCLSEDVAGCFRIMERGVEGTIVEMPDNCAPNTLARVVSLQESSDQKITLSSHSRRTVTSKVFDLTFDKNLNHTRRDSGNTKVRIDYSNVPGYWNAAVDSPGINYDDESLSRRITKRFYAERNADWRDMSSNGKKNQWKGEGRIDEDVDIPLFWDTADDCDYDGKDYEIGFGAHVGGTIRAYFSYAFSVVAGLNDIFDVQEANGWLNIDGESDLTYSVGGVGQADVYKAGKGNPATTDRKPYKDKGHTLSPSSNNWISFQPYYKIDAALASFNTTAQTGFNTGPYFDGKLSTRVKSDFGGFNVNFPPNEDDERGSRNIDRESNHVSMDPDNVIYSSAGSEGRLQLQSIFQFGMKIDLGLFSDRRRLDIPLADITMKYKTYTEWSFYPSPSGTPSTCLDTWVGSTLNWEKSHDLPYMVVDNQNINHGKSCYPEQPSMGENLAWGYSPDSNIHPNTFLDADAAKDLQNSRQAISCSNCLTCGKKLNVTDICCGCVNMDLKYGLSDIPPCESCMPAVDVGGPWPGDLSSFHLEKRVNGKATKSPKPITIGGGRAILWNRPYLYPAFPADATWDWENIEQNRWDPISRYWGNTSMSCSDWSIDGLRPHDTAWIPDPSGNGMMTVRAAYQTEHVFEAQLIGDFFDQWLKEGMISNQFPPPDDPRSKVYNNFVPDWITKVDTSFPWRLQGVKASKGFIHVLLSELGNMSHLDRLAILKTRPNGMKGAIFGGKQATSRDSYLEMNAEEKLMATKEMGLVFEYLNHPTIWDKFCDTYEALWTQFGRFDAFYATQSQTRVIPSLQDEWKEYIEVVLTSMVYRSQFAFQIQMIIGLGMATKSRGLQNSGLFSILPGEILNRTFSELSNADLKNVRLACTYLHAIAHLRLHRVFLSPNPRDIAVFIAVADHKSYRLDITEIIYDDARFPQDYQRCRQPGYNIQEDIGEVTGVPEWFQDIYRSNLSFVRSYGRRDVKHSRHIEVLNAFKNPCSPIESYEVFEQLSQQQAQTIAENGDQKALEYGLSRFSNLKRITITPFAHGVPGRPLYCTPTIRSLPSGIIYPIPRSWPITDLQSDEPMARPWAGQEKDKWRGYCLVGHTIAREANKLGNKLVEFVIDSNHLHTGISCRVFDNEDNDEYKDIVTILEQPGFANLDLSLYCAGQSDENWSSFRSGLLRRALSRAVDLQRMSLRTNIMVPWEILEQPESDGEEHFIPLRNIFPVDAWPNLRHFCLSRFLVKQQDVIELLGNLPTALESVELSFLHFLPDIGDYHGLLKDMRNILGWRDRPACTQPMIIVHLDIEIGQPEHVFHDVSQEVLDFVYGNGNNPFEEEESGELFSIIPEGVGMFVDPFDHMYKRPN
ncbi:bacteriodes thetaiotaomicron symbiotic chitinase, partial [Fusarium beomiforme]